MPVEGNIANVNITAVIEFFIVKSNEFIFLERHGTTMAEPLGVTAGIIGLVATAISFVHAIRKAQESVKGVPDTLHHVSSVLDAITHTLDLVGREPRLHTAGVEDQVRSITRCLKELHEFFEKLQATFQKGKVKNYMHALTTGDADENELARRITRLDGARAELLTRISVVHVGLTGNIHDGFKVALQVLEETNASVQQVLGLNLVLATRLQNRELLLAGPGIVALDTSDIAALKLGDLEDSDAQTQESQQEAQRRRDDNTNLNWVDNTTLDEPRIFVGNLGVGSEHSNLRVGDVRSNVTRSSFGKGLRLMNGHVGGEAAKSFADSFFQD
ncbi:hypothetical protein CTA2_5394 [Colletotrichum tanaceti]|uniref:NACHT-NTPase and P-loop NTPases N-terminal domain-containing protein n=1 Tax=Colletotrichum tanaceti TaxID=1306861 RepID=A0A4U6X6I8_9PEZI|nr:hypothetical protein CTA2_5394 [Colletotrichum tanaceti]TKW50905.1 hypothetical protein CTA1_2621 [Colletotrichum tanaceti]